MNITLECSKNFAKAQIHAGADIIGIGDAAASLISPSMYKEFVFKYEKDLIDFIHENGAKARLHICGNTFKIADNLKLTGADIIDVDWMVPFGKACEIYKGYASACGNFDPTAVVYLGNPDTVRKAVKQCLLEGDNTTCIMAGCEIPQDTPHENLMAIYEALK